MLLSDYFADLFKRFRIEDKRDEYYFICHRYFLSTLNFIRYALQSFLRVTFAVSHYPVNFSVTGSCSVRVRAIFVQHDTTFTTTYCNGGKESKRSITDLIVFNTF